MEETTLEERQPPTDVPPEVAERLGFLFGKLHQRMLDMGRAAGVLPEPFTGKHFGHLTVIMHAGPLSQQELGRRLGVDRTTVVAIVDDLERAGFVVRRRNPDDRRAYALQATDEGRAWQARACEAVREAERQLLARLSEEERRQLIGLLQRLVLGESGEAGARAP